MDDKTYKSENNITNITAAHHVYCGIFALQVGHRNCMDRTQAASSGMFGKVLNWQ